VLKKLAYQSLVSLIWAIGLCFALSLAKLFATNPDSVREHGLAAVMVLTLLFAHAMALFSFWRGAQIGHVVRAFNIFTVALLSVALYRDYAFNPDADLTQSWIVWVIGGGIALFNLCVAPGLKSSYERHGRVDYFEVYFGNR
jgi:hypothetical protein